MNKICVYAITKNEEQFVERWYESMKEADSIVVLDTGSTDNTVKKLLELGVSVNIEIIDPWRFDVARNEAMKMVPDDCNILISTDLDEILEPGWSKPLRERWIDGVHQRAEYKYTWSHGANGEDGRVFRYNKIHTKDWEWRAPVHELLYNKNTNSNNYYSNECLDLFDKVHLHHYPDQTKSRASYLPLLELRAEENPDDYYGLIYLAHEYYYRGLYRKSIDLLDKIVIQFDSYIDSVDKASCYLFKGDSFKALADIEADSYTAKVYLYSASIAYLNAIEIDETYREPYLDLAKVYLSEKNYALAEYYIKEGIRKSYRHYSWLERDTSWTYEPYDLLCLATFYQDKKRDSIAYAYKALSYESNNEHLKSNLDLCLGNTSDIELIQ